MIPDDADCSQVVYAASSSSTGVLLLFLGNPFYMRQLHCNTLLPKFTHTQQSKVALIAHVADSLKVLTGKGTKSQWLSFSSEQVT